MDRLSPLSTKGRRTFMKATAVGLGTLLAGCSGGGNGGGGGTDSGGGGTDSGGGGTDSGGGGGTTSGDQEPSFSGTSIDYWDVMNVQSNIARQRVQEVISSFENNTGASVEANLSGYSQMMGQQWVSAWRNEEYPVAFNHEDFYFGRIFPTGNIKPFAEYQDQLSDGIVDDMEWAMDIKESAYRFWDIESDPAMVNPPFATGPRNPFTVRTDFLEQAGYSVDDIPSTGDAVQNYEELMTMAQDVQSNSDAQYGFHTFGATADVNDTLSPFMSAQDAQGSSYISEDGTEAYPSDLWAPWIQRQADMYLEYEVSGPQTPSISDEEVATQLYAGDTAMSTVEPLNYPTFIQRAPDLLENGNLQFVPFWEGSSGASGHTGFHDHGVNKKPSSADAQRWERKLQVGYEMMNRLYSPDFQTGYTDMVGWMGIRDGLWPDATATANEQTNIINAMTTMLDSMEVTWPYHRYANATIFAVPVPYWQQVLAGDMSGEDAMAQARNESNANMQAAIDELGPVGEWPIQ
jgi:ABC-type glycerol-3-phosphate transport system substrate-binding protein